MSLPSSSLVASVDLVVRISLLSIVAMHYKRKIDVLGVFVGGGILILGSTKVRSTDQKTQQYTTNLAV